MGVQVSPGVLICTAYATTFHGSTSTVVHGHSARSTCGAGREARQIDFCATWVNRSLDIHCAIAALKRSGGRSRISGVMSFGKRLQRTYGRKLMVESKYNEALWNFVANCGTLETYDDLRDAVESFLMYVEADDIADRQIALLEEGE